MATPNFIILYVDNPLTSADFYTKLLDLKPVESAPGFALFVMPGGVKLGLWKRSAVAPAVAAAPGGSELCFPVDSDAALDSAHADWIKRGLKIAQPPTNMDFGRTFTALDPDGHRLRVFSPV